MLSDSTTDLDAAGLLEVLAAAEVVLGRLGSVLFQVGSDQLGDVLAQVRQVGAMADASSVAVVAEATGRGVAAGGQPGSLARTWTREWVQRNSPRTDPATITRLVTLGNMAQQASRRILTDAVADGRVGLVTAAVALAEFERLEPEVSPAAKEDTLRGYVDIAAGNDPAVVRRLRPEFLARFGAHRQLERTIDRLREQRHLSGPVEFDQLTHYALTLDPEGAARLEAGLVCSPPRPPPRPRRICAPRGNAAPTPCSPSYLGRSPPEGQPTPNPRRSWSSPSR